MFGRLVGEADCRFDYPARSATLQAVRKIFVHWQILSRRVTLATAICVMWLHKNEWGRTAWGAR